MKTIILYLTLIIDLFCFGQSNDEIISYYKEVTYGSEFSGDNIKTKFNKDVYIFVNGDISKEMKDELNKVIDELNNLINTVEIRLTDNKGKSNINIYFGSKEEFVKILPISKDYVDDNYGLFFKYTYQNDILCSYVFVDTYRTTDDLQRKHLLREELTQSLGFGNDSMKYPDSIFYQEWSVVNSFSKIDCEIIKMLYNN